MTNQQRLLSELTQARNFIFDQLADLAKEEGKEWLALAWEWMRDHRKYPSPRHSTNPSTMERVIKWGWSFSDSFMYSQTADSELTLEDAESRGPTILPYALLVRTYMNTKTYKTEEEAIVMAARYMAQLFRLLNEQTKKEPVKQA